MGGLRDGDDNNGDQESESSSGAAEARRGIMCGNRSRGFATAARFSVWYKVGGRQTAAGSGEGRVGRACLVQWEGEWRIFFAPGRPRASLRPGWSWGRMVTSQEAATVPVVRVLVRCGSGRWHSQRR